MALQIRINPAALRAAAERQRVVYETAQTAKATLGSMYNKLDDAWDGGASATALNDVEELRGYASQMGDGVNESADKLVTIAEAFENLEFDLNPNKWVISPIRPIWNAVFGANLPPLGAMLALRGSLRIIPDAVREVASMADSLAKEYEEAAAEMKKMISTLENSWEGRAFTRFQNDTQEMVIAYRSFAEKLMDFADELRMAANRYEELDNSLA